MSPDRFSATYSSPGLVIAAIEVGSMENISYVVACTESAEAILIDAAAEPDVLVGVLEPYRLQAIVTTHGHADHHGAATQLADRFEVPVLLSPDDHLLAGGLAAEPLDAQLLTVGRRSLDVLRTPGHTPGSTCFSVSGHLFSGDTLFPGGPGATRWDYSNFDQIIDSIESVLFPLGDDVTVHPGHGKPTTIGAERPHLDQWKARRW